MAIETTPWDSAELLDTPEAVAAYIEVAFEDGAPSLITHALAAAARAKGMAQLARERAAFRPKPYAKRSR
jgi:probable addiction module antidote protein